jgi:hypothetical protein
MGVQADDFAQLQRRLMDQTQWRYEVIRLIVQVYHLLKAHPDAGRFRIWSLLARPDISECTIGRTMALNKLVYDDIAHVLKKGEADARAAPLQSPRGGVLSHPVCLTTGKASPTDAPGLRGRTSREGAQASNTTPVPSTAVAAL